MREIIFLQELDKTTQMVLAGKLDIAKLTPVERARVEAAKRGLKGGDIRQTAQDAKYFQNQANTATGENKNSYNTLNQFTNTVKTNKIQQARLQKHGDPKDINNLAPQGHVAGSTAEQRAENTAKEISANQDKVESGAHSVIDRRTGGEAGYRTRVKQYNTTVDARNAVDQLNGGSGKRYQKMTNYAD